MTDTFTRSTGAPGALRLRCVRQNPQTNGTISFWKDPSAAPESIATAIRRLFSSIHATIPFSRRRTRNGAFRRLEPYAGKPARTVLRGERGSNAADLLDGYKATSSLLSRKSRQYPAHYSSSRASRYKQDIASKAVVCDCIGGAKGFAWTGGGQSILDAIGTDGEISNQYASNNCPDKSANGMFSYAKQKGMDWGSIDTLPNLQGLALHMDGHVGYTVGDGYAVEWRGFKYGCIRTKISERGWKYWYKLPVRLEGT